MSHSPSCECVACITVRRTGNGGQSIIINDPMGRTVAVAGGEYPATDQPADKPKRKRKPRAK